MNRRVSRDDVQMANQHYEKMLNTTSYKRNTNQKHEILPQDH